jgi:hypothetical protein
LVFLTAQIKKDCVKTLEVLNILNCKPLPEFKIVPENKRIDEKPSVHLFDVNTESLKYVKFLSKSTGIILKRYSIVIYSKAGAPFINFDKMQFLDYELMQVFKIERLGEKLNARTLMKAKTKYTSIVKLCKTEIFPDFDY